MSYVRYKDNGEIDPIRLTEIGVDQYDAPVGTEATDLFKTESANRYKQSRLKESATLTIYAWSSRAAQVN
jgi:hypothetical protein